jgi:hypothetical protein
VTASAGPGRYVGGAAGSPLVMLDALRSHKAFDQFGDVKAEVLPEWTTGAKDHES